MPLLTMKSNLIFLNHKFVYRCFNSTFFAFDKINSEFNAKVVDCIVREIGTDEYKETLNISGVSRGGGGGGCFGCSSTPLAPPLQRTNLMLYTQH